MLGGVGARCGRHIVRMMRGRKGTGRTGRTGRTSRGRKGFSIWRWGL